MSVSLKFTFSLIVLLFLSITTASTVAAHGGGEGDPWHHWAWQDLPLLLLIGSTYALGLRSLWRRARVGSGISRGEAAAFGGGWIVLFIALVSPLDFISEQLFAVHMVQHLLLMLVAAPLFVLGRFPVALAWALSARGTTRIWKEWRWRPAWKFMTRPAVACLLNAISLWTWHMPRLYQAALLDDGVHFLQHLTFFTASLLFWQVFADLVGHLRAGSSPRFGLGIFSLFVTAFLSGFLGVLIAFSPYVWYPVYSDEAIHYGLTALEDQQLGGTIMWVPAGLIYLASAISVLGRWLFAVEAAENPQI